MKKFFAVFIICMFASTAFGLTAKQVYEKTLEVNYDKQSDIKTYILEYDSFNKNQPKVITTHFQVSDGIRKTREDIYTVDAKNIQGKSSINTGRYVYVGVFPKLVDGEVKFKYSRIALPDFGEGYAEPKSEPAKKVDDTMEYSFADENASSNDCYVIQISLKNKQEILNGLDKNKSNDPLFLFKFLASIYITKQYVNKSNFTVQEIDISPDRELAEFLIKRESYYKELSGKKQEEYFKKELKEKMSVDIKTKFSDYRSIAGTKYMYPYYTETQAVTSDKSELTVKKVKYFKIATSKEVDKFFNPPDVEESRQQTFFNGL